MSLSRLLLGRTLANREQEQRKIGAFEGVPAMGLDGLGSSAYGPEAALTILMPLGVTGLAYIGPIIAVIVGLLAILFASYWQTVRAYPTSAGAYAVSKANFGERAGLIAAAALMLDYVLNVAVGISAGVGALVSAVPSLHPHILTLCLGLLAMITVVNLRGTLDAGRLFALPTYLFVACFFAILGVGVARSIAAGGAPVPVVSPPRLEAPSEEASTWLLLHAFASGCTAMTGVEAVSNGVAAFKQPVVKYAHRTLTAIVAVLGILLAGIAYLASRYEILAMDQEKAGYRSVLAQLAGAVVGHGAFYYVAIGSVLCVLALSANTSFVDFPRLCRMVAEDGYLPRPFAIVGRRLVYSVGILYLAFAAGLLLVVFGGITDRLIPLFAIGAFLTFTMSQGGMVVHWRRALRTATERRARLHTWLHLGINALGATTTAIALAIIVGAKFVQGAWITVIAIPGALVLLSAIKRYYDHLDHALADDRPVVVGRREDPVLIVATQSWNKLTDRAVAFALRTSSEIRAVHLRAIDGTDDRFEQRLRDHWAAHVEAPVRAAGRVPPPLLFLRAEYRFMHQPVLELVAELEEQFPERTIAVLIPELIKTRWWQFFLHNHHARRLRNQLLRYGGSRLVIIDVPGYLEEPPIARGVVAEPTVVPVE